MHGHGQHGVSLSSDESASLAARRTHGLVHENHQPSHLSAQSAEVQATNIKHGFVNRFLIAIVL
jgi:hypothetical protein